MSIIVVNIAVALVVAGAELAAAEFAVRRTR